MKLVLIRHGETEENKRGIVQGWYNSHLNKAGHRQAEEAVTTIKIKPDAIFSSDLARCIETAYYFQAKFKNTPFFTDWRLRERCFGDAQTTHRDMHDWEVFWASEDQVSIPNAETLRNYNQRVKSFLTDLEALRKTYKTILIVTHGGTINRIQDLITKGGHDHQAYQNGSITEIML